MSMFGLPGFHTRQSAEAEYERRYFSKGGLVGKGAGNEPDLEKLLRGAQTRLILGHEESEDNSRLWRLVMLSVAFGVVFLLGLLIGYGVR